MLAGLKWQQVGRQVGSIGTDLQGRRNLPIKANLKIEKPLRVSKISFLEITRNNIDFRCENSSCRGKTSIRTGTVLYNSKISMRYNHCTLYRKCPILSSIIIIEGSYYLPMPLRCGAGPMSISNRRSVSPVMMRRMTTEGESQVQQWPNITTIFAMLQVHI